MVPGKLLHFSPLGWFIVPAAVLGGIIPHLGRKSKFLSAGMGILGAKRHKKFKRDFAPRRHEGGRRAQKE